MNFIPNSSNFNSANQQQQQQIQPSNMSNFNDGAYFPNLLPQYPGYQYSYPNNFSCPSMNNYNQSSYFNYSSGTTENTVAGSKREHKPLVVIDPQKNVAIDLLEASKASKAPKTNSLLYEKNIFSEISKISPIISDVPKSHINRVELIEKIENFKNDKEKLKLDNNDQNPVNDELEHKINDENNDKIINQVEYTVSDQENEDVVDEENFNAYQQNEHIVIEQDKYYNSDPIVYNGFNQDDNNITEYHETDVQALNLEPLQSSTSLQSFPNKMENSSISIDSISQSAILSDDCNLNIISTAKNAEKGRLVYDRDTLLKISKSDLCRKPNLDCSEIIEVQGSKIVNLSNHSLDMTSKGYKTPKLRKNIESAVNNDLETSQRNFKSVLNKIVPQNFDLCFSEIIKLIIKDEKHVSVENDMNCLIVEIFAKAVQEEGYSVTYADLCTEIIKYQQKNDMKWSFKELLIKRCKDMFETPLQEQLDLVRNHWEKKIEEENDDKLRNLYKSDIEEQVKKAKDKYFGNIRFIGELYLHDLLRAHIIDICIKTLISKGNDEDALLSLCKLLETCGKKFDHSNSDKMKECILQMTLIAESTDLHTRIKFRLYDIIDMSERDWVLRSVQAQKIIQPKTLDQVKKDDLDEKMNEASKLAIKLKSRLNKKHNSNNVDIKLKINQNRNSSFDCNSLMMQTNDHLELKPSYGQWSSGSSSKDEEWQNVDCKRTKGSVRSNTKIFQSNSKLSPIIPRRESPCKLDIGGRFSLLQKNDTEDNIDLKTSSLLVPQFISSSDKEQSCDIISLPSTREQSPIYLKSDDEKVLNGEDILQEFLETNSLDMDSWCQLSDVSHTVAIWLDKTMEKSKLTRNMVADELAKLVINGQLTLEDLTEGLKRFSEDIEDLKPDIPLIWNFMAEFLERFIRNSESDISFFKTIFESQKSLKDVANCIALCLNYADNRHGHDIIKKVMKKCSWTFEDFGENTETFVRSKELDFLLDTDMYDLMYFKKYRKQLMIVLPNNDEEVNQFLEENFDTERLQTKQFVYFIFCCVFSYSSNLSAEDIIIFFKKKELFFKRLIYKSLEFEEKILEALIDTLNHFKEIGLLESVVYGLSDSILSYEAFQQFIQKYDTDTINGSNNSTIITDVIKSVLETRVR